jgi:hypothetical protein
MLEALLTAFLGLVVVVGGLYCSLRFIVLAGQPESRS